MNTKTWTFARMSGAMRYTQCDNGVFLHNLLHGMETEVIDSKAG